MAELVDSACPNEAWQDVLTLTGSNQVLGLGTRFGECQDFEQRRAEELFVGARA
jgi:hypothetical protein